MKNYILTLFLFISTFAISQKTGIDFNMNMFNVNIPDKQFAYQTNCGIGFDINLYEYKGKGFLQLTPVRLKFLNSTKKGETVAGKDYYFVGSGIGYFHPIKKNLYIGSTANLGFTIYDNPIEAIVGLELAKMESDSPLKIGIFTNYSFVNQNLTFGFRLGFAK